MSDTKDLMQYEHMAQEALRGVIKQALKKAASPERLPGDHHLYITFQTRAPGVSVPNDLAGRYRDEMTIVLQHQFWDLAPGETFFSVTLKFGGQPKALSIPYAAITHFRDPGVEYHIRFTVPEALPLPLPAPAPAVSPPPEADAAQKSGDIVSLDQFRKK